ncbi:hypothetical protein G7084_01350 [Weissella coleopterorum]|uniref:Uncharacterized protein n=1 Tax=Weissella coleopterorum TaxID=2714949 RepID=A0A6G8AYX6_9LACO|nr:hypothetical protein [Weissella coleopterorum]QIL50083.1 hypothetical protein G7084_01350 [Weissella coleopterorum]
MYTVSKEIMDELNTLKNGNSISTINELMIDIFSKGLDLYAWFYKSDALTEIIAKEQAVIEYVLHGANNFKLISESNNDFIYMDESLAATIQQLRKMPDVKVALVMDEQPILSNETRFVEAYLHPELIKVSEK